VYLSGRADRIARGAGFRWSRACNRFAGDRSESILFGGVS
jgi:hypothetical protein